MVTSHRTQEEEIGLTPFSQQVIAIIQSIPRGKVMTYGQIAALAGQPRAARQVVRLLHSAARSHRLPWHRVVNARGEIAIPSEPERSMQASALIEEGVAVDGAGRIDLQRYRHMPPADAPDPTDRRP